MIQELAARALNVHKLKMIRQITIELTQIHHQLWQFAWTLDSLKKTANGNLQLQKVVDEWTDTHPIVRYVIMVMANISCPKRDCNYYQTENIVKELAGVS